VKNFFLPSPIAVQSRTLFALAITAFTASAVEAFALTSFVRLLTADGGDVSRTANASNLVFDINSLSPSGLGAFALISVALALLLHILVGHLASDVIESSLRHLRSEHTRLFLSADFEKVTLESRSQLAFLLSGLSRNISQGLSSYANGVSHLMMILGFLIIAGLINLPVTAGLFVTLAIIFSAVRPIVQHLREMLRKTEASESEYHEMTSEIRDLLPIGKASGLEFQILQQYEAFLDTLEQRRRRSTRLSLSSGLIYRDIALIGFGLFLLSVLSLGDSVAAEASVVGVLGLRALASAHSVNMARNARSGLRSDCSFFMNLRDRLEGEGSSGKTAYFEETTDHALYAPTIGRSRSMYEIKIDRLTFGYDVANPLFQDLTISFPTRGLVCITGRSGTGKSTLLELVLGLRRPWSGAVLINGVLAHRLAQEHRLNLFAYCPQESPLLPTTLRNNLSFFRDLDISQELLADSLQSVGLLHDFKTLNISLDTHFRGGEMSLSGGQRQRVAILRTILSPAQVLVFDEPTTGLDADNAEGIRALLHQVAKTKRVIVVSHDPVIVGSADFRVDIASS